MNNCTITVITPTYNRANLLPRLFDSLCRQTCFDFQWLIIDDGSTDETEKWINSISETRYSIDYYKKTNGGKHTALNYSHPYIKGKLVVIVDSDDYLLPSAIEIIKKDWGNYENIADLCGMSYLKGFANGTHLSVKSKTDFYVANDIDYRVNNPRITGDRCEVTRTELFIRYAFPEFDGEKFLSEDMLWNSLALDNYNTLFRNELIYVCEYVEGGLTRSGRQLRLLSPKGMLTVTRTYLNKRVNFFRRIKATWLYICYSKCSGMSIGDIVKSSGQSIFTFTQLPFGLILYRYWALKYLKD